jgi:hypothetical protein
MAHLNLASFAVCNTLESITKEEIQNSIKNISTKIPNVNKLNNINNYTELKHAMVPVNYWNYMKNKYMESCCWLINMIEDCISDMVLRKKDEISKCFYLNFENGDITGLSLTTDPDVNTNIASIQEAWVKLGYGLPFYYIKELMIEKGYMIETYSNKTNPDKIKNTEIKNSKFNQYQKPLEIYEFTISKKYEKNLKKNRSEEEEE